MLKPLSGGLSPLARGTLHLFQRRDRCHRFIPAGAGNTIGSLPADLLSPVYPRWRGEHWKRQGFPCSRSGLSPLARGTRHPDEPVFHAGRFIPAGAGNTCITRLTLARTPVYPRWRGEHASYQGQILLWQGLSPLARGTLISEVCARRQRRFIPAGAGNTAGRGFLAVERAVYPRWRGEHPPSVRGDVLFPGLSPLARGTQDDKPG